MAPAAILAVAQIVLTVASIAYQQIQANKAKKAADKNRGFRFTVGGEATTAPVVYGKQMIGGVHNNPIVRSDYDHAAINAGGTEFSRQLTSSINGKKNEYLFVQLALAAEGLNAFKYLNVNSKPFSHRDFKGKRKGHRIHAYTEGFSSGTDNMADNNGYPSSNNFTGFANAHAAFRLDRKNPQYNGIPNLQFFVEGKKLKYVNASNNLVSTERYDGNTASGCTNHNVGNNPAYVLLDYLMNTDHGAGVPESEIDLPSFRASAVVCDTTVATGKRVAGRVNDSLPVEVVGSSLPDPDGNSGLEDRLFRVQGSSVYYQWAKTGGDFDRESSLEGEWNAVPLPTRDIPLYECNISLDTQETVRDNINKILATMDFAELTWNSEGKYQLSVNYPTNQTELEALVDPSHVFGDDDIVRESFDIGFYTANERFNQFTISFRNEHEDFNQDSITWPSRTSSVYTTYLEQDNFVPLSGSDTVDGITDPYHAKAKAEQTVRASRAQNSVSFVLNKAGLTVEPGDLIKVTCSVAGVTDEIYRVQAISITSDFNCKIEAYSFSHNFLAWNAGDGVADKPGAERDFVEFKVDDVENAAYVAGSDTSDYNIGKLTWDFPTDYNAEKVKVYYKLSSASDYIYLGETQADEFSIPFLENNTYDFELESISPLGSASEGVELNNILVTNEPSEVSNIVATEELYYTNVAAGVKSKLIINWDSPTSGILPLLFRVSIKPAANSNYVHVLDVGKGSTNEAEIFDLEAGIYDIKIETVSFRGILSTGVILRETVAGKSTLPSDPTGFTGNLNGENISLSWDLPTANNDLDVVYGGSSQIRYSSSTDGSASWEASITLVESLAGAVTSKTVPTLPGTYLIKFEDSSGNLSANAATFISTFIDPNFNVVTTVDEHTGGFTGTKTNCSVSGGDLILNSGQTEMTYEFANTVNLNESTVVRLTPNFSAIATQRNQPMSGYTSIASVPRFAGSIEPAAITVYIKTSEDNVTYTDWKVLTAGNYAARYFKFKVEAAVESTNNVITFTELGIDIDKKDLVQTGEVSVSDSGAASVTFTTPFYGGIGGSTFPRIGTAVIDTSDRSGGGDSSASGDTVVVTNLTKTGMDLQAFNSSGTQVARTVHYQAIGQ